MPFKYISDFQKKIIEAKYCFDKADGTKETFDEVIERVAHHINKYDSNCYEMMKQKTVEYFTNGEFSCAGGGYRAAGNPKQRVSSVNCSTQSVVGDSIESIGESITWWSKLASYGQGNGIDISGLRPRGSAVGNCSKTSTGAVSFLTMYDAAMQVIGAENRRGATKPDIWVYHPDIVEFINCKKDITKLTSQNISVKVDNRFMQAVKDNTEIELSWERKEGKIFVGGRYFCDDEDGSDLCVKKTVKARELFNLIVKGAWSSAEPGIEFWETSEIYSNSNYHPDRGYHIVSTNGCFGAGTLVTCLENNKDVYKKIEDIRYGDFVKSYDPKSRRDCYQKVIWSGVTIYNAPMVRTVIQGVEFYHTHDHLFFDPTQYKYLPILECKAVQTSEGTTITDIHTYTESATQDVYDITVEATHNFYANNILVHNCSEQKLDPWNTCILASINFAKMPSMVEDWESWLKERVSFGIRFLDNTVLMELEEQRSPHPIQRKKLEDMTRIGLGFTGLADWFIKNKIVYGSKESQEILDKVMSVFTSTAYRSSIALGKERGSFNEFDEDWFLKSKFVQQLIANSDLKEGEITHMRHVCCVSVAPTGSISFVMGAGGSGCEPLISPWSYRKERATTGEYVEHYIFNDCVINELNRRGLEVNIANAKELINSEEWRFAIFENGSNPVVKADEKIELMKVLYKYMDSGISVTYNLPETATEKDVYDIYFKAWESGLKSVTVYRDKCREGVYNLESKLNKITKHDAVKRPKDLNCEVHYVTSKGEKWIVIVSLFGEEPYELFCGLESNVNLPQIKKGIVRKIKRGQYLLITEGGESIDINQTFQNRPAESALARAHSLALRHGVDVSFVVDQLEKSIGDMSCFSKVIARVLKKYIPDGKKVTGESCPQCNSSNMQRVSGCVTCLDCFWSKC